MAEEGGLTEGQVVREGERVGRRSETNWSAKGYSDKVREGGGGHEDPYLGVIDSTWWLGLLGQ